MEFTHEELHRMRKGLNHEATAMRACKRRAHEEEDLELEKSFDAAHATCATAQQKIDAMLNETASRRSARISRRTLMRQARGGCIEMMNEKEKAKYDSAVLRAWNLAEELDEAKAEIEQLKANSFTQDEIIRIRRFSTPKANETFAAARAHEALGDAEWLHLDDECRLYRSISRKATKILRRMIYGSNK